MNTCNIKDSKAVISRVISIDERRKKRDFYFFLFLFFSLLVNYYLCLTFKMCAIGLTLLKSVHPDR